MTDDLAVRIAYGWLKDTKVPRKPKKKKAPKPLQLKPKLGKFELQAEKRAVIANRFKGE